MSKEAKFSRPRLYFGFVAHKAFLLLKDSSPRPPRSARRTGNPDERVPDDRVFDLLNFYGTTVGSQFRSDNSLVLDCAIYRESRSTRIVWKKMREKRQLTDKSEEEQRTAHGRRERRREKEKKCGEKAERKREKYNSRFETIFLRINAKNIIKRKQ